MLTDPDHRLCSEDISHPNTKKQNLKRPSCLGDQRQGCSRGRRPLPLPPLVLLASPGSTSVAISGCRGIARIGARIANRLYRASSGLGSPALEPDIQ